MLSIDELAKLRDNAEDWLPDTCTIQTPSGGVDSTGGITLTFVDTYTNVPCRIDPSTQKGGETVRNFSLEGKSLYTGSFKCTQGLDPSYRVVHSSTTYEIEQVLDNNSWVTLNRAYLVKVD
jgi:hypothetical protein